MAGVLYLILSFMTGGIICRRVFPHQVWRTGGGAVPDWFIRAPAAFLTGTLVLTWAVYLTACAFRTADAPLTIADAVVMSAAGAFLVLRFLVSRLKHKAPASDKNRKTSRTPRSLLPALKGERIISGADQIFFLLVLLLGAVLMWYPFFVKDGSLYTGYSVFSDFSPHLGMIRSFTRGDNFPTQYTFYAGEDVRYHFMFQFLAGNLEHLGLRIDFAFNLPSLFSFVSCVLLLYTLAVKITGKRGAGYLCAAFFCFRSSGALFDFLANVPSGTGLLSALKANTEFLGTTPNENWGLWNLNVYCNQRHFAFGLCGILFLLHLFVPAVADMAKRLDETDGGIIEKISVLFFSKEGWLPKDGFRAAAAGLLLGGLAFFNGACVIAALAVLLIAALFSERRLELLIAAAVTTVLSLLQSAFFVSGSVVRPQYFFGFIAENKTVFGAADYLIRLCGILPAVLTAAFLFLNAKERRLFYAFLAPAVLTFTVSLTPDITVNHKYLMISVMLLDIIAAGFVWKLFENRRIRFRALGAVLVLLLTASGIYDFITVIRRNGPERSFVYSLSDPLTVWVQENADSDDIFLTANYAYHPIVLGGAMLYQGWPYFAWSAGYDTDYRAGQVKKMYEAGSSEELKALVRENEIRYIVVDSDNRLSADYSVREDVIWDTYEKVYEQGEGEYALTIYDTQKLK